jgi:hypothetical protein
MRSLNGARTRRRRVIDPFLTAAFYCPGRAPLIVMAALDAAIQDKTQPLQKNMDGRVKPGHDNVGVAPGPR